MIRNKLSFSIGNAKLKGDTAILSLPAGHSCPAALACLSKANKVTGKLTDGPASEFRCYAASGENLFPVVRKSRWHNFNLLRGKTEMQMADVIYKSLPTKCKLVRIHASGDFFSQTYFDAWVSVATVMSDKIFYAYTKALPYWIARRGSIPDNFKLVASLGGKHDDLILKHNLRNVLVVYSEEQAHKLGLPIDHDDTHAWNYDGDFALLIHGTQPKGTQASKILYSLRRQGKGGYKSNYFGSKSK